MEYAKYTTVFQTNDTYLEVWKNDKKYGVDCMTNRAQEIHKSVQKWTRVLKSNLRKFKNI